MRVLFQQKKSVFLFGGTVALLFVLFLPNALSLFFFPVELVGVKGEIFEETRLKIQEEVSQEAHKGLLGLSIKHLHKKLLALPWIEQATLKRCFPNTLKIEIKQKHPVARFGEKGLLDKHGRVFFVETVPETLNELPLFLGEFTQSDKILRFYRQITPLFAKIDAKIKTLHLDSDGSWVIMLANGVSVRLGHDSIDSRLNRFLIAYPRISQQHRGKIKYLDLRYTNGIVVG